MAFNPFHSFRRYSKTVFAGLAILCMFTFVLSSGMGQGDFFSQIASTFGGGGGNTVVTLHGTKIDARQFDSIQNQRRLAGSPHSWERRASDSSQRSGRSSRSMNW